MVERLFIIVVVSVRVMVSFGSLILCVTGLIPDKNHKRERWCLVLHISKAQLDEQEE